MKYIPFVLVILLFLSVSVATALRMDCIDRGVVSLELSKEKYFPGEKFQGGIIVTNKYIKASPFTFTIKLSKDNYVPWEITMRKKMDPGTSILKFEHIFASPLSVPYTAELGKWELQLITEVDDCIFYEKKILDIFSCSDGIRNGDEENVDCGGSCPSKCPKSTKILGQVIFKSGYYKQKNKIWTNMKINPLSGALIYKGGRWMDGSQISLNIPPEADIVAAYGCCCTSCDSEFKCGILTNNRYKVQSYNEWECGWNIIYL